MKPFNKQKNLNTKCPKCGKTILFLHGNGVKKDLAFCFDVEECKYEYEFDTSTFEGGNER